MDAPVYDVIELVGTSTVSESDAIKTAIARAAQTLKGLAWFEMLETRGPIANGRVPEFQVKIKVGFRLLTEEQRRGA